MPATHYLGPINIPDEFWTREDVHSALAVKDMGALFKLLAKYGASQTQIGTAIGMAQGQVSLIIKGRQVVAIEVFERISNGLHMPDHARQTLGLAPMPRSLS